MTPFETLNQPEVREFYDRDGNVIRIPVLRDLTPNEEIAGLDLQEAWEKQDTNRLSRAVEYRVEAVAILLSSRSGSKWTPEDVKTRLTSKTTRALFQLYQDEIKASMAGVEDGGQENETPKPPENTGAKFTGDSKVTSQTTPDSEPPISVISPSG